MVFGGVGFEIDTWIFDEGIEVLFSMGHWSCCLQRVRTLAFSTSAFISCILHDTTFTTLPKT
jgi:hypothetical protein